MNCLPLQTDRNGLAPFWKCGCAHASYVSCRERNPGLAISPLDSISICSSPLKTGCDSDSRSGRPGFDRVLVWSLCMPRVAPDLPNFSIAKSAWNSLTSCLTCYWYPSTFPKPSLLRDSNMVALGQMSLFNVSINQRFHPCIFQLKPDSFCELSSVACCPVSCDLRGCQERYCLAQIQNRSECAF